MPGLEGRGLPFAPTLTVTCLTAGLISIAMGLLTNYPLALAPGMGLNAVVAFELVAGRGLSWPEAMTIVLLEGLVIAALVVTRFREAVMEAVPLALQRAIGGGIGLFIAFIGFYTAGFVVKPATGPLPVALGPMQDLPMVVFVVGFLLTACLMARRVPGALLLGIVLSTALAVVLNGTLAGWQGFATPGAARLPAAIVQAPDFSTFGRLDFGVVARLGIVATVLVTFALMLSDFFDTMGTVLVAMWFSPLASVIPAQATGPALVIVGFYMMSVVREIAWDDYDDAIPAFVTMLVMPFTWSITNGIGAGFVTHVAIRVLSGRAREVPVLLHAAAVAFVAYFALPLVERTLG